MGDRRVLGLAGRIEAPADRPDTGRIVPGLDRPSLREPIHPPFRIVCRRDRERVRIVRVWRSERLLRLSSDDDGSARE